uniref:sulfatase family protein n=1 Tax=Altererythrobacter segetis TaxID=1104773 RepID=UPI00140BD65F|nr:sulfatase-like hydrolase/transferase [Altererythrobacter segetis]
MKSLSRRNLLAFAPGLAAAAAVAGRAAPGGDPERPNIIFILADDMGVADLSCYGAPQIRTPAIDRIAAEGARFTQAYAASAVCTASRVGIITGRYQYRLPIGLEEPLAGNDVGLPPTQPVLPSILKAAGYETWLIGKWHLGSLPKFGPLQSGYDHFFGFRGGALDYFKHGVDRSGKLQPDLWDGDVPIERHGYLTELLGQRAVEVIRAQKDRKAPLFMSLHFNAPHWPWETPDDEQASARLTYGQRITESGTLATYNRMVEEMDRQVGRLLEALAQTGQAENTLIVFTSDNGGERFSTTWPFNGRKSELLEGGIRIPSVVRWPGRIPQGLVSEQPTIHLDWLPTLTAVAGTRPDPRFPSDGLNLLPVLAGAAKPAPRTLYWRYKANAQRAVRMGDYKALKIGGNTYLFNVVDDPMERANLKNRMPEVYRQLTAAWMAWNAGMLPESPQSFTYDNAADEWADRINLTEVDTKAVDDGGPWP